MIILKRYRVIFAVVLPIIILVLVRQFGGNYFKHDAQKWASPSFDHSNIISTEKLKTLPGKKLIINLEGKKYENTDMDFSYLSVSPESLLGKKELKSIRKFQGSILLTGSTDLSVRAWMILSQMGVKNIYVLSDDIDNEVLKYKFRPDTLVRPEQ